MFLPDYDPTKNRGRFAVVPLELITDPNVSDGSVRLFAYLAAMNLAHSDPPRREQIAADLTITPTSVTNRVKELVARDWVIAWKHFANELHSNAYQTFNSTDECREYRDGHSNVRYIDFKSELERRKIRRGNRAVSNQFDDQTRLIIKPDGLTQQGHDQTSLTDHDQTSLPPYIDTDSSIQTQESVNNRDPNDSVAVATGGEISSEESALSYNPNKPETDPTPSPDEIPPSSPVPPPSSSQSGVPDGYMMRYAGGSGRTAHLVHVDATETACGKPTETLLDAPKPDRTYNMCPQCMTKLRPIVRKPSIDQPVKDAIAEHLQGIPLNMATSYTGVLANIAISVWKRKLGRALLNAEYEKVGRSVTAFVADYQQKKPGLNLPTSQAAFEENFTKFLAAIKGGAAQPDPQATPPSKPRDTRRSAAANMPHGDVPPEELTDEQLKEKWS